MKKRTMCPLLIYFTACLHWLADLDRRWLIPLHQLYIRSVYVCVRDITSPSSTKRSFFSENGTSPSVLFLSRPNGFLKNDVILLIPFRVFNVERAWNESVPVITYVTAAVCTWTGCYYANANVIKRARYEFWKTNRHLTNQNARKSLRWTSAVYYEAETLITNKYLTTSSL